MTTLTKWLDVPANQPDEKMLWKSGFWQQVSFVEQRLQWILKTTVDVVSTHRSKSIILPVYRFHGPGHVVYMRENFHGWVVSVELSDPLHGLPVAVIPGFDGGKVISVYAEGFNSKWVFPAYYDGSTEFTCRLDTDHDLYMFLALLKHACDSLDQ